MIIPNKQEILQQISRVKDLPPLPSSLERLLAVVQSQVTTPEELENIIHYDQSLTARVLRVANGAYYGNRGKVTTISRAIALMGFDQVKSVCLLALLLQAFEHGPTLSAAERESLWKHAFCTARLAGRMVERRPWATREKAYLFGLLHDLGKLVMLIYFQDYYLALQDLAREKKVSFRCMELQFGLTHTRLGRWVAVKWGFPEVFQNVMEFHHTPWESSSHRPEVKLIALADILANSRNFPDPASHEIAADCCRDLHVGEDEWEDYRSAVKEVWLEVEHLWRLLS